MLQQRVEQWNQELRERGRQEGRDETRCQVAMALIQRTGLDDTTVAESTGLSVAEVEVLRDRLRH
ncbi:hypothetical protein Thiowin_04556 [Thiorhodovibrio winogradskyi]|uniref:Transposase n=1 Tax=Thiorhodovibrio winogradskyi TaxID=77007 RepID=A0ABZ0SEG2_9GAMM|nr:hypothetical protein [Thiorhodovibrio winogradskyi]